jgi:hypothetical protein
MGSGSAGAVEASLARLSLPSDVVVVFFLAMAGALSPYTEIIPAMGDPDRRFTAA